ncbi:hypothetical protein V1283_004202 [Bradyrhizobium sp. AZCC 2262]
MTTCFKPPIVPAAFLQERMLLRHHRRKQHPPDVHFIWPISKAAPLAVFDSRSSASRPPAA